MPAIFCIVVDWRIITSISSWWMVLRHVVCDGSPEFILQKPDIDAFSQAIAILAWMIFSVSIPENSGKVMFVPIRRQIPSGCPFPLASNSPDIGFFSTNNIRLRDFLIYCDIKKIGRDVYCLQIGRTYTVFFIFYQERDLIRVTDILPIETAHKRYNHFV